MLNTFPALTGCSSAASHAYAELPVLGLKDKSRPTSVPPEATVAGCRWICSGLLWHAYPRWASSAGEVLQEQLGSSRVRMSSSLPNSPVFIAWGHKVSNNIEMCHPHKYLCRLCKGLWSKATRCTSTTPRLVGFNSWRKDTRWGHRAGRTEIITKCSSRTERNKI